MSVGDYEGFDVEKALQEGDEHDLWTAHQLSDEHAVWERAVERSQAVDAGTERAGTAQSFLDRLPPMTALQGLSATGRLVDLLVGRRWIDMQRAREKGASWTEIGQALSMTKQGAHDWYRRAIADRERHLPDLHDTARARAVLDDSEHGHTSTDQAARRALAHEHALVVTAVSGPGMALGMWAGRGDWEKSSEASRDKAGVRAVDELDSAIAALVTFRERLARAVLDDPDRAGIEQ